MLTSTVNTYEVTGSSATDYTFNQPIHKAADLTVYVSAVEVPLSGGSNPHTVTVATNKQSATVVFGSAPGAVPLKFVRTVEYKQETDLANNSLFDAESLETSLDNIVMQTQQASKLQAAGFGFHPGIDEGDYDDTAETASTLNKTKAQRASKALAFDADGDITVSTENIDAQIAATASSADDAEDAKDAAEAAQAAAEAVYDNFDDRYLGTHTTAQREVGVLNIGLDHDGSALVDGALYFDTTLDVMKVWSITGTVWKQLTPTSANQTNIDAAVADASDIGRVAAVDAEIGRLGTSDMSVGADAYLKKLGVDAFSNASSGYIKKVSTIDANVTKVADIDSDVTKVADIDSDVSDVADIDSNVTTVAGKDAEIGRLGTAPMAASIALIGTAPMANSTDGDIKLVSEIAANVTKVADIDDKVTIVAGLGSSGADVTAVAGKATEIGRLGTLAAVEDMGLLGLEPVITDMDLLGASGVIDDMEDCADALVAINGASANATAATNAATSATASEVSARASAAAVSQTYDNFSDVYLGSMADGASASSGTATGAWAKDSSTVTVTSVLGTIEAGQVVTGAGMPTVPKPNILSTTGVGPVTSFVLSDTMAAADASEALTFVGYGIYGAYSPESGGKDGPLLNNDGDALVVGNLYFNTSDNEMRLYDGGNWIAASAAGSNSFLHYKYVASGSQTSFSGSDANGATLSYTVNNIIVFLNGVRLDTTDYTATNGTAVVLDDGAAASDELVIISLKSFTVADMVPATAGGTFGGAVTFSAVPVFSAGVGAVSGTTVTASGLFSANGGIETDTNSKVVQKGAFMQSSTHQALTLGY